MYGYAISSLEDFIGAQPPHTTAVSSLSELDLLAAQQMGRMEQALLYAVWPPPITGVTSFYAAREMLVGHATKYMSPMGANEPGYREFAAGVHS